MPGRPDPGRPLAIAAWEEAFGSPPPPYLSVTFLRKAVAYDEQCRVAGGLSVATRRTLRQIAEGRPVAEAGNIDLRSGSHLVREWNGRTYLVEVTDGGFRLDGKDWPSLSAIAKHITGTTWSGPRFFGLTRGRASSR